MDALLSEHLFQSHGSVLYAYSLVELLTCKRSIWWETFFTFAPTTLKADSQEKNNYAGAFHYKSTNKCDPFSHIVTSFRYVILQKSKQKNSKSVNRFPGYGCSKFLLTTRLRRVRLEIKCCFFWSTDARYVIKKSQSRHVRTCWFQI